jgi:hypothetical protein
MIKTKTEYAEINMQFRSEKKHANLAIPMSQAVEYEFHDNRMVAV